MNNCYLCQVGITEPYQLCSRCRCNHVAIDLLKMALAFASEAEAEALQKRISSVVRRLEEEEDE